MVDGSNTGGDVVQEFDIGNQEVEYILYGFHNPAGNISAAYAEIFSSRLAVRTMEGFIVNSKLGNPLAILAAAILYGIEKAIEDMIQLCQKGSVQLSKYAPLSSLTEIICEYFCLFTAITRRSCHACWR